MRRQGIWTKIVALFALIAFVAPMSVRAALCLTNPVGMRCCMETMPVATKVAVKPEKSCCSGKTEAISSTPSVASDDSCKCVIKTLPKDLQGDVKVTSLVGAHWLDDSVAALPTVPRWKFVRLSDASICLYLSDSGPPRDGVIAPTFGRAPPVN